MMNDALLVAIALVEHRGLWLVSRRWKPDGLEGLWEFPGGKIEDGETAEVAATRECREELGITVAPVETMPVQEHDYETMRVRLHPVLCRWVEGHPRTLETTLSDPRWVSLSELQRLEMPAANAGIIARLAARFGSAGNSPEIDLPQTLSGPPGK